MKMKKISIVYLLFFTSYFSSLGQCSYYKDTVYMIYMHYYYQNIPAGQENFISDDISFIDTKDSSTFLSGFYKNCKLLNMPYLSLEQNLLYCYGDSAQKIYNIESPIYFSQLKLLEDSGLERKIIFNNSTFIVMFFRFSGEFWFNPLKNNQKSFNFLPYNQVCLKDSLMHSIKKIDHILPISEVKSNELKSKFNNLKN